MDENIGFSRVDDCKNHLAEKCDPVVVNTTTFQQVSTKEEIICIPAEKYIEAEGICQSCENFEERFLL